MTTPTTDPQAYRRTQRRRATIGWLGGFLVVAVTVALIVVGASETPQRQAFKVPYGETMTAKDYSEIHLGEEDADVLGEFLDQSGRPEKLTEEYVLVLFPPAEESAYCTYWEFSDDPQIFARLCFSRSTGELVQKLKHSVYHPLSGRQGQVV